MHPLDPSPATRIDSEFSTSEPELAANWKEIRRSSPEEGLKEAEQIYDEFKAGIVPGSDPVFGDWVFGAIRL